jgi:YrbI family 3-deoxy-D-manno-octulosonate 8-phosphate phosphatase
MNRNILAIIPARGGSKGIPKKNIIHVAGKPLIAYTIIQALESKNVTRVVVSTDDSEIAHVARQYGAEVIERPGFLATDDSSSEDAILHVLDVLKNEENYEPDLVVLLQCTSPLRQAQDIDKAIDCMVINGADSLLSVSVSHRFIWRKLPSGVLEPINYDYRHRPRRQDMEPNYLENGSIYIFKPWVIRKYRNRLGGKIHYYIMDYWSSFEIDEPEDLALCEWVLLQQNKRKKRTFPSQIDAVIFDFDGVFTDNTALIFEDGREAVIVSRADGLGISLLKQTGVVVRVLSAERNPVVAARCDKLGIEYKQGVDDKLTGLIEMLQEIKVPPGNVVFVGNDINDIGCMTFVGFSIAVADAHESVRAVADLVLKNKGGRGAVREVCELLIKHLNRRYNLNGYKDW